MPQDPGPSRRIAHDPRPGGARTALPGDSIDRPESKVEIINGRIVVRELPTIAHAKAVLAALPQLVPFAIEGMAPVYDAKIFLGVQKDRYGPIFSSSRNHPACGTTKTCMPKRHCWS